MVPFTETEKLSTIIKSIEHEINDKILLEIEMNNLEDAYINIAKKEKYDQINKN